MSKIDQLLAEQAELKQAQSDLQATVDAEQLQIQELLDTQTGTIDDLESHISDLDAQIEALNAQIADAGDPTQLQSVIDGLETLKDSLAQTKADIESTVSEASTSTSTTETTTESTTSSTTETSTEPVV